MLTGARHRPRLVRLRRAAVRHRLLRRQARRRGPHDHRQPVHLRAVARGVRDVVDVLRQRRARGHQRHRLSADLPRPDADGGAVVVRDAQDHPHQQGQPHHLARRLHRLALRQERAAGRPGDRHRGDRHPALHLAAAEGDIDQLTRSWCSIPEVVMPASAGRRRSSSATPRSTSR